MAPKSRWHHSPFADLVGANISLRQLDQVLNDKVVYADNATTFTQIVTLAAQGRLLFPVSAAAIAAGRGFRAIDASETTFAGTIDPGISIGYNWRAGGLILAGEPAIAWVVEGDYNDGSGQNKIEAYLSIFPDDFPTHAEQRPFFCQYNRVTRAMAFTSLFSDNVSINTSLPAGVPVAQFTLGQLAVFGATGAANALFNLTAAAGGQGIISMGLAASPFYIQTASPTQTQLTWNSGAGPYINLYSRDTGAGIVMAVGVNDNGAVATFANISNNGLKGIVARGKNGQTATLFEAQDFNAAPLWNVTAAGVMVATTPTTAKPSIRLPHGVAPSAPTDGDMWTTTTGLFIRINGTTVGPLT